ncbi:MAG: CheW protein [Gemmatimonadetes bacterium]|nr:CheW protein [Gemmatimonadota bacterium]
MKAHQSPHEILAERARVLAMPRATGEEPWSADMLDILTFVVGGERLALPMSAVSAIIRAPVVTPLPHAVAPVYGVTVSRGRALTVLSLGASTLADGAERRLIVIGDGGRVTLGLLVDAVDETRTVARSALSPAAAGPRGALALGITADAVLVLDTDVLLMTARSES